MKNQYLFLILIIMLLGCTNESKEFSKLTGQAINNNLNEKYLGPIIDMHAHIYPSSSSENFDYIDNLVLEAKKAGVSKICLGLHARHLNNRPPTYSYQHDKWIMRSYKKYPDIIIPFLGSFNPDDETSLVYVENELKKNIWKGIGELDLRNSIKQTKTPMNSTIMMRVFLLASKYDVPVLIHNEFCYGTKCELGKNEMRNALKENPQTIFIIAHECPIDLMSEFSNLMCELNPFSIVPNEFVDRIIIGTDVQSPDLIIESGSEIYLPRYYEGIDLIRQILFQTHDAEKIAYSNAAKILNLKS